VSVTRTPDPSGLLDDKVEIDPSDPTPEDRVAFVEMFEYSLPWFRVERLRRHESLSEKADALLELLKASGNLKVPDSVLGQPLKICSSDYKLPDALELQLLKVEHYARYLDTCDAMIEKKKRDAAKRKHSNAEIDAALHQHNGNRTKAGKSLKPTMTPRGINMRIRDEDELAHWRKS